MRLKPRSIPKKASLLIDPAGNALAAFLWDDINGPGAATPETVATVREVPFPLDEYASCKSCPKRCGFDRIKRAHPSCGDFQLRVASYGLALGDEPEISGSRGSGAIMLSGCPLRCPSCHSLEMVKEGTPVSIGDFLEICRELEAQGAENIQILSPTCHQPALRAALGVLKNENFPIPIVWKGSGFEAVEELKKLEGLVDVYLPDLKFGSCSSWAAKAGVKDYFSVAKEAIFEMIRQVVALRTNERGLAGGGVLVRHVRAPLPPGETAEIEEFLSALPAGVKVSYLKDFMLLDEFSLAEAKKRAANEGP